ncbi:MAG: MFS transporter [Alistipes sp.]|nr:MFS transporter [Alistipes sp.]
MTATDRKTNQRWIICAMLFFATAINYMDRQVLSLTWEDFIRAEFHWSNNHYGTITGVFSLFYAISMLFVGRIIDKLGTRNGYLWSIGIWSAGACLHALCSVATEWLTGLPDAEALRQVAAGTELALRIGTISLSFFIAARCILALGEAGNFPAAIKATAEYFPKKDRAFATSIFNAGATIGALAAPFTIPVLAAEFGWEMAFLIIGALGFVWMGFWLYIYRKPELNPRVNAAELAYIDSDRNDAAPAEEDKPHKSMSIRKCFGYRQTWSFILGKFMTDGVWWFFLFWTPSYLKNVYGLQSTDPKFQIAIGVLYLIVMGSIFGGYLPTYFIEKFRMNPYEGRMRAMLIFAFLPMLTLLAQPLGHISMWIPVVIIGIAGAAHQAWSANIFSTVGDIFPKYAVATVTGIGGMAGGISSFLINQGSGYLFDYTERAHTVFMGFEGINAGYFIVFSFCAVAYLIGWLIMKSLVPRYAPVAE